MKMAEDGEINFTEVDETDRLEFQEAQKRVEIQSRNIAMKSTLAAQQVSSQQLLNQMVNEGR
jgi:hypothetical protein